MDVIALQVFFSYDNDLCVRELTAIKKAIGGKIYPAMHDKRHIALVFISNETPENLVDRLRPVLDVGCVSNYWAQVPTAKIAGKYGGLDTFVSQVRLAYGLVYQRTKPKHVITPQAYARKNRRHDAVAQMPIERGGDREQSENAYESERWRHRSPSPRQQ